MVGFTAKDVGAITGVKRTRLQQWIERGFVAPSLQVAEGHGTRNIWSRVDLYTIAAFEHITERGFSRELTSQILAAGVLPSSENFDFSCSFLVFARGPEKSAAYVWGYDASDLEKTMPSLLDLADEANLGELVEEILVFNLGAIVQRVDAKIAQLGG